jgi:hypothetical protein
VTVKEIDIMILTDVHDFQSPITKKLSSLCWLFVCKDVCVGSSRMVELMLSIFDAKTVAITGRHSVNTKTPVPTVGGWKCKQEFGDRYSSPNSKGMEM